MEEIRDHLYEVNHTWITSVRRHMRRNLLDGLIVDSRKSKPLSFLSFPVPECSCLRSEPTKPSFHASSPSTRSQLLAALKVSHPCPAWMERDRETFSQVRDTETDEDVDDDDSATPGSLFGNNSRNQEGGDVEMNSKDETQMDDQEELEGGER